MTEKLFMADFFKYIDCNHDYRLQKALPLGKIKKM